MGAILNISAQLEKQNELKERELKLKEKELELLSDSIPPKKIMKAI